MRKLLSLALSCLIGAMSVAPGFAASFPSANVPDGIGVNLYYGGSVSTDLDLIRDAGFKYVRKDLHWHKVETSRGNYNWSQYDQLVDSAAARGMKMVFILCYNNTLYGASSVMNGITTSTQRTGFANFAKAAAARYKGKGVIFELWNEPNVGTFWRPGTNQTQYIDFVKTVSPAIRQADPNATIIGAGLAWADPVWHEGLFSKGLLNYVDALSLHPYDKNQLPERWMNTYPYNYAKMRELIKKYNPSNPNMPIISSEWGYSVTHPFLNGSEQAQANYIARCQLLNLSMGVPLSIWFDFRNHDGTLEEGNYGIVRNDYSKKPAYYAIQNLTNSLKGTHFVKRIATTSSDYLMEFTDGTKTVVAAWTTGSSHSVTINGQSKTISGAPIYVTTGATNPTPTPTAPTAPSNCAVTSVTKGATTGNYYVNIAWTDNSSNETGFQVQQAVNSTTNFQTVKTVAAGTTVYSADIGAAPAAGTYYRYRVIAANGTVLSPASNVATTQVGTPNAPTTLALTQTKGSAGNYLVNLTWKDNSGIETGFKVLQSRSATTGFTEVKTIPASTTSTSIDLGTAPAAGTYYYQVIAYSAMGNSAPTNTVNTQIAAQVTIPSAPSNVAVTGVTKGATSGNYYVNLAWTDNSNNETGFNILQSVNSASYQVVKTVAAGVSTYALDIGTSPVSGSYSYKVVAVNSAGQSVDSNIATTQITQPVPVPAAVSALTASAAKDITGKNVVILGWTDNSTNESGFNVYVSNSATGTFTKIGAISANSKMVIHSLDALSAATNFYYQLKAYNSGGESSASNTASVLVNP